MSSDWIQIGYGVSYRCEHGRVRWVRCVPPDSLEGEQALCDVEAHTGVELAHRPDETSYHDGATIYPVYEVRGR